jgi:alpha-glutamyl/putrescinyl thymine pyrophosphorylase clade 1
MPHIRRPINRPLIYDLYWQFASRRQAAFDRRASGKPRPWSDDPIIERFKFCNVFRAADRVSQYMIRTVACAPSTGAAADRLFRIIAFRTFSQVDTWNGLMQRLNRPPVLEDLASGAFEAALDDIKRERGGLYTGAFILCATKAFGFDEKHRNHVALFKHMFFEQYAAERILGANSFEHVVKILQSFPLTGPFMSYQIATDINYSDLIEFDENDYTQAGPGALRGIKKAFVSLGDFTPSDIIKRMVDRQEAEFNRLELPFHGLWGRPLHAIDCQGLFCELDKYCREAVPELTNARSRIKARFRPSSEPIRFCFPAKWGLNNRPEFLGIGGVNHQLDLFPQTEWKETEMSEYRVGTYA